ncbi:hypothetical protein CEP53_004397 [Fusarium sp. AF-6]|nr:hypothetical protein CEP53_004397 [Fusarium sp. AF-6]
MDQGWYGMVPRGGDEEESSLDAQRPRAVLRKGQEWESGMEKKMHASLLNPFQRPSQCNAAIEYKHGGPLEPHRAMSHAILETIPLILTSRAASALGIDCTRTGPGHTDTITAETGGAERRRRRVTALSLAASQSRLIETSIDKSAGVVRGLVIGDDLGG